MTEVSTPRVGRLLFVTAAFITALFFIGIWVVGMLGSSDLLSAVMGDWIQFHRVGERLAAGEWTRLYPDSFPDGHHPDFPDGLYFLYPPFALPGTLLFARMTPLQAYATCVAMVSIATLGAVGLTTKALGGSREDGFLLGLGVLASAFFLSGLILGHLSTVLGLVAAAGFYLHRWGRPLFAGFAWALLLAKPNWGIPLFLLCLVGRQWKTVGGLIGGAALLGLVGALLGHGLWEDWGRMIVQYNDVIRNLTPPEKQLTVFASLQSLLGVRGAPDSLLLAWGAISGALSLSAAYAWWIGARGGLPFERLFALAMVVILAVNPYAYYYDGILLLTPAAVWWIRRDSYGRLAWRTIGVTIAFVVLWGHVGAWMGQVSGRPSLVGWGVALWAVVELVDLLGRGVGRSGLQRPVQLSAREETISIISARSVSDFA